MPRASAAGIRKALPRAGRGARAAPKAGSGSLTAHVAAELRAAIVDGRFALGEALSELKLAAVFGVSRTPVRDALTVLQVEGLIDVRPQSGSFVFTPSARDVAELAEFRRVVELAALRLCFAHRRDDALREMRAAADAMARARESGDRLGVARADSAFHRAIVENSANAYLIAAYRHASGRVAALRTHTLMSAEAIRSRSLDEHRGVIRAFAKGDLDRAAAILEEHVLGMSLRYRAPRGSPRAASD